MTTPTDEQNQVNDVYRSPTAETTVVSNAPAEEANYNIIDWFKKCIRNYVNFSGRARRKEYWNFVLVNFGLTIVAAILDTIIFDTPTALFYFVVVLGLFLPGLSVLIRRLHDTGRSGWWFFISLIPLIGTIILFVFLATETKFEQNKWGAPAK